MLDHPFLDLESWVLYFRDREPPVLNHTIKLLEAATENRDRIAGRDITQILLHDPLMATRVLTYIQPFHGKKLRHDITTIGSAVMMMGIDPFFDRFKELVSLEKALHCHPEALLGAVHVIQRAQHATSYAMEWATWRHDANVEEVALATLLHDLAEILLWCYAPSMALEIQRLQHENPTMRSSVAQERVLGIRLIDLQKQLCHTWNLPELMLTLIGGEQADNVRVRNVQLAVDLARHSAHGWTDPALPDDYKAISELLNIHVDGVLHRLGLDPETGLPIQPHPDLVGEQPA
jgi:HD-like signal output (HDOD) protein